MRSDCQSKDWSLKTSAGRKPSRTSRRYKLDIQVHDFESVFLDELAARFDVFSHQRSKDVFGGDGVFQFHLEERAGVRVHRGVPKLFGVHFTQALESRDGEIF